MLVKWPTHMPRHSWSVTAAGRHCDVLDIGCGALVMMEGHGPVPMILHTGAERLNVSEVEIKPLRRGVAAITNGGDVSFVIPGPGDTVVAIEGLGDLYILYDVPDDDRPDPAAPGVRYFGGRQIHDVGELSLGDGEELYVEAGTVLSGAIRVEGSRGVRVHGRGIIDCSGFARVHSHPHNFLCERCEDVRLEGLTFIGAVNWTVKFCCSRAVRAQNLRVIVHGNAHDGIDVNGSSDVVVSRCFVRSDDDCVAVKSCCSGHDRARPMPDVRDVTVEKCILYSFGGGSAMEMGHEFCCDRVENVTWRDIDVLAVHLYGAALSIRNCDAATLADVLYEDVRVEHHYDAFIVFRITKSRFSWPERPEAGHVERVTLRRVVARLSPYNPGYTVSDIGGYDEEHAFEGVRFENCRYGDRPIRSLDDFAAYAKHAHGLEFA
ncbi:MAG: hypothetical protein J6333_03800 [Planctomycetes bacterium]|nr:hypothetical protein [Planctomycetota bacterium]